MTKTIFRALGGVLLTAVVAVLARGGAAPAHADPAAVVMFNQTICSALGGTSVSCALGPAALEYGASGPGNTALMQASNFFDVKEVNKIDPTDFAELDTFTGRQVLQQGGEVANPLQSMVVVAYVANRGPVTFHANAGYFAESGTSTWVCDGNPGYPANPAAQQDPDCSTAAIAPGTPSWLQPDGAVVANLRCTLATCPARGTFAMTVEQDGIVFPTTFTVVGEPVNVSFFAPKTKIQAGVPFTLPGTDASAKAACPFSASVAFVTKALGEAEKTVLIARASDIDGTNIAGAWINWSVDDPNHNTSTYFDANGIMAQPVTPTLNLGGFGYGAPNIVCAPAGAPTGTLTATARLIRTVHLGGVSLLFDPFASPGIDPSNADSSALSYANQAIEEHDIPSKLVLTSAPASIPCDGTATSTVSAALTDAAGNPAISGTAVHFDTQVLATANPIDTKTNDKGIATSVISPLAGDVRGVPVTVSVEVGGVTQDAMTQSIMIQCSGAAPAAPAAPAPGGGAAAPGGSSAGTITAPNTGTGGVDLAASGSSGLAWALAALLAAAGTMATATRVVVRRRSR